MTEVSLTKTRKYNLDIIKTLAIIATIAIHVTSLGSSAEVGTFQYKMVVYLGTLFRFCVPAFCMCSGYLLNNKYKIELKYIFKYVFMFAVIFIATEVIYRFIYAYKEINYYHRDVDYISMIKDVLKGNTKEHLYYLYLIAIIYLVSPITHLIVKHEKGELEYILLFWIVVSVIPETLKAFMRWDLIFPIKRYMFGSTYNYIMYGLLGGYLKKYEKEIKTGNVLKYIFIWIVSYIGIVWYTFSGISTVDKFYMWNSNNILTVGMAYGLFCTILKVKINNKFIKSVFELVSKNTLNIYLFHIIFLDHMRTMNTTWVTYGESQMPTQWVMDICKIFICSIILSLAIKAVKKFITYPVKHLYNKRKEVIQNV